MKLLVVLTITFCITHGIQADGIFGEFVGGASKVTGGIFGDNSGGGIFGGNKEGDILGPLVPNKDPGVINTVSNDPCSREIIEDYKEAQSNFYKKLYARVAARSDNHFVFSPSSIWLSLSALAEGADPTVQSWLFTSLNLPQEKCVRNKYYDIAFHVEEAGREVNLYIGRNLFVDEALELNPTWANYVSKAGLLDVAVASLKSDPEATFHRLWDIHSDVTLKGNSIIIDHLAYYGLWTTAFGAHSTYTAPFYNDLGQPIGTIEMMKAKRHVRLAQVPFMSTKVLELPVGYNGRYTMLIVVGNGNNIFKNAIDMFLGSMDKIFNLLELSVVPVEIAVPKFVLSSEFDVRPVLEDIGVDRFWSDPKATSYISNPSALPGSYIQRTYVNINSSGIDPISRTPGGIIPGLMNIASNTASEFASVAGRNFIADRPFMFALFDTKTRTCIFAGAYSKPNGRFLL